MSFTGQAQPLSPVATPRDSRQNLPRNLPRDYYYEQLSSSGRPSGQYLLFRRLGRTVIGLEGRRQSEPACFRGFFNQGQIENVTRVSPPYRTSSRWQSLRGLVYDLNHYQATEHRLSDTENAALVRCIQAFSR
ncbi:hypothetical protein H6F94_13900 [Leptolyngbya sp. FACHB-261]|nr:hypothetical protein [Leptolyngbya sp. FACHB-261]